MGLLGCLAVLQAHRGQGIATRLVRYATEYLARTGAKFAFVGYTYSGMERLYGKCGYKISSYYLMGKKTLQ
ncbi:MAG: GNAT family N-acetyltransferase [Clostridia bacterium]|nr:GNAT family N-acetyltransferase [Clostridia bacterium]